MTDDVPPASDEAAMGTVIGLLRVIAGLLVVIAIVLLLIFVRGPEGQQRSTVPTVVTAVAVLA